MSEERESPAEMAGNLIEYLRARDRERLEAVERMAGNLTERERALVREAAVMGYVQGRQVPDSAKDREAFPKDSQILFLVLDAARAFHDLYPNLSALEDL